MSLADYQRRLRRIGARLSAWPAPRWGICLLVFYGVLATAQIARYHFNPGALLHFGHYYVSQNEAITPPGATRFIGNEANGGNGYDGQIFYYYARTLLISGKWPNGFSFAYRAPRVGYPLLAAPFALLAPLSESLASWATALALPLIQALLLSAAASSLCRMLPADQRWSALLFILSPFLLLSFLLSVSDGVAVSMSLLGFAAYRRALGWPLQTQRPFEFWPRQLPAARLLLSWLCFSLAILAKESALFFLFPLGLAALWSRRTAAMAPVALALAPALLWQLYLRSVQGMAPAGILAIFLAPLDGMRGMLAESSDLLCTFFSHPGSEEALALAKQSAKWLLFLYFLTSLLAALSGRWKEGWPFRLALLFTLLSIAIADYYYFWSVFDNVARMFAFTTPALLLLAAESPRSRTRPAMVILGVLSVFVALRVAVLSPRLPADAFEPYAGPGYAAQRHLPPGAW
ncbi:MAG: hypothetical protein K1X75_15490 [Leptospirales bacterium]|nr:hypothetical protein [Leptospirales bacterium]